MHEAACVHGGQDIGAACLYMAKFLVQDGCGYLRVLHSERPPEPAAVRAVREFHQLDAFDRLKQLSRLAGDAKVPQRVAAIVVGHPCGFRQRCAYLLDTQNVYEVLGEFKCTVAKGFHFIGQLREFVEQFREVGEHCRDTRTRGSYDHLAASKHIYEPSGDSNRVGTIATVQRNLTAAGLICGKVHLYTKVAEQADGCLAYLWIELVNQTGDEQ